MKDKAKSSSSGFFRSSFIETWQVSLLLGMHIRNAQEMLKDMRRELKKPKNAGITVNEFCAKRKLPLKETLKALEYMSF
jgi:hypothetical protein